MAGRKKKASRRPSGATDGAKGNVEPEDISPEATESQSLQMGAPPSTAMQPDELKSEDKTMEKAEERISENTSELRQNLFRLDGARTLAALYIETTAKLAEGVLTFQATATEWAKDTPLAVVLEAQHSMVLRRNGPSSLADRGKARRITSRGELHPSADSLAKQFPLPFQCSRYSQKQSKVRCNHLTSLHGCFAHPVERRCSCIGIYVHIAQQL